MKTIIFLITFIFVSAAFAATQHQHHQTSTEELQKDVKDYIPSGELKEGVREVNLEAFQYSFKPDPIVVKYKENIRLLAKSTDVTHGIGIAEFKINVALPKGKVKKIEFVADKKGTFIIHCSVYCGFGHGKMHGRLIVK